MEKVKKKQIKIIIGVLLTVITITLVFIFIKSSKDKINIKQNNGIVNDTPPKGPTELERMLSAIVGVRAENLEIIDNPIIGFKGHIVAPQESIKNGIDYFLKNTENDKMKDLEIDIHDDYIAITVDYRVLSDVSTGVMVKIIPKLNQNGDLRIAIKEVRLLNLKIPKFIVDIVMDNFIEDWFPKDGRMAITFTSGEVTILKENFKNVILENISILDDELSIDAIIDMKF